MDAPVLNDRNIFPDNAVLSHHLGKTKRVFDALIDLIAGKYPSSTAEWRYYKDGKSWLCKLTNGKRTICWISVRKGFFLTTFYFAVRHKKKVCDLKIDRKVRNSFIRSRNFGKIAGLTFTVRALKQLEDITEVIQLKEILK